MFGLHAEISKHMCHSAGKAGKAGTSLMESHQVVLLGQKLQAINTPKFRADSASNLNKTFA